MLSDVTLREKMATSADSAELHRLIHHWQSSQLA
jgi:hypothetical protein